ncbi:MAG: hypothetical protein OXC62_05680 [Aestuariivita sp.]|nr:hypothetical protein [Aestuariivita sp.]
MEDPAEILSKKLLICMYGNGEFVARDFYDLGTAHEKNPSALKKAFFALNPSQRIEIRDEIQSFGSKAVGFGRALENVHCPEWLSNLAEKTVIFFDSVPPEDPKLKDSNRGGGSPQDILSKVPDYDAYTSPEPKLLGYEDDDPTKISDSR